MRDDTRTPAAGPQGQTIPVQGDKQERVPRTPHERDESATSQAKGAASQQTIGEIALDDLKKGKVDTDKGPVLDAAYEPMRNEDDRSAGR